MLAQNIKRGFGQGKVSPATFTETTFIRTTFIYVQARIQGEP